MGRSFNPSSFPSKRNFQKMPKEEERGGRGGERVKRDKEEKLREEEALSFAAAAAAKTAIPSSSYYYFHKSAIAITAANKRSTSFPPLASGAWMLRLRSALAAAIAAGSRRSSRGPIGGLPRMVAGTLFGRRRGRVRLAFQADPRTPPALLLELAAPTAALVREMASGLVRIALECDHASSAAPLPPLLEEPVWRAYCNGRKCGRAVRRECGDSDRDVLRAVEAVSVGAGVLPAGSVAGGAEGEGERGDVMYMRAKFERVVGSRDSEAFYMMSPDGTGGGPELSIYLLRV
ncbi:Protein MIZU-KUSSEI 1 [Ananas comosus]|uniref:Protein MIZU-KUSSEI 1 n=1 Tax=Ananas comosus TaxID=4615 RepID=A0A199UZM5_ANACO|nr:Protein MIZU-KUSSEI 1 [Ananas comosus]